MKRLITVMVFAATCVGGAGAQSMERMLQAGLPARWWREPLVEKLGLRLTTDQLKKLDEIFQQNRIKLIDLNAALQKEEALLEPMVAADRPDEMKTRAQIDRVAQARADLEKANAYLALAIRIALTPEQWRLLQTRDGNWSYFSYQGPSAAPVPKAGKKKK